MSIDPEKLTPIVATLLAGYLWWSATSPSTTSPILNSDPLPHLPAPTTAVTAPMEAPIRDPFGTSTASTLVQEAREQVAERRQEQVVDRRQEEAELALADLRIEGVVVNGARRFVMINDRMITEGQEFKGMEVVRIGLDRIVFQVGDRTIERWLNAPPVGLDRSGATLASFQVEGIMIKGSQRHAMINGVVVSEGEKFEGIEVVRIDPDKVLFRVHNKIVEKHLHGSMLGKGDVKP